MYFCAAHHFLVSLHQDAFCYILPMGGSPILTTCKYTKIMVVYIYHYCMRYSSFHSSRLLCAFSLSIPIRVIPLLALQVTTLIIPQPPDCDPDLK